MMFQIATKHSYFFFFALLFPIASIFQSIIIFSFDRHLVCSSLRLLRIILSEKCFTCMCFAHIYGFLLHVEHGLEYFGLRLYPCSALIDSANLFC